MVEQGAREFFCEVRRACARLEDLQRSLDAGVCQRRGAGPAAPGYRADPIGSLVVAALDAQAAALREMDLLERMVGGALVVVGAIGRWLYPRAAQAVECRYIDRWAWDRVAEECGVDERTCRTDCDVALDWVDAQGLDWLRSGHAPRECGG